MSMCACKLSNMLHRLGPSVALVHVEALVSTQNADTVTCCLSWQSLIWKTQMAISAFAGGGRARKEGGQGEHSHAGQQAAWST